MENVAKEINAIIISAATEKGYAAEHRTWGHGAFTYAMEKGLKG